MTRTAELRNMAAHGNSLSSRPTAHSYSLSTPRTIQNSMFSQEAFECSSGHYCVLTCGLLRVNGYQRAVFCLWDLSDSHTQHCAQTNLSHCLCDQVSALAQIPAIDLIAVLPSAICFSLPPDFFPRSLFSYLMFSSHQYSQLSFKYLSPLSSVASHADTSLCFQT